MTARTSAQQNFMDVNYVYDKLGNIIGSGNIASPASNGLGGATNNTYIYDNLNRLTYAIGDFNGNINQQYNNQDSNAFYEVKLGYNNTHGIVSKRQDHQRNQQQFSENTYDNLYEYNDGTHQLKKTTDSYTGNTQEFYYDNNGNIGYTYKSEIGVPVTYYWDESNRLRAIDNELLSMHHYIYDAGGERVLKGTAYPEQLYNNGTPVSNYLTFDTYTTYPSAYIVVNGDGQYSKHYYAGSQRIVSRIGEQDASIFDNNPAPRPTAATEPESSGEGEKAFNADELRNLQISDLTQILKKAEKGIPVFKKYKPADKEEDAVIAEEEEHKEETRMSGPVTNSSPPTAQLYFYHPDHLGSSTFLTDANGEPYQFFLNLPFGETMAEQHSLTADYETPYKFNGKELDSETGLYYYGARYYNPRTSIWLSVDPLMEIYPNVNPYAYCVQNPVKYIDPTGRHLEIGKTEQSKKDISNLVSKGNRNRLNFSSTGVVTINFDGLSEVDKKAMLKKDKGLSLINDMVNSEKKMLYEASEIALITNSNGDKAVYPIYKDNNGVMNLSNNGKDSSNGYFALPRKGYDGQVIYTENGVMYTTDGYKNRNSFVFHELAENYYRTHFGYDYNPNTSNNNNGAHNRANTLEGNHYGNPTPGGISEYRRPTLEQIKIQEINNQIQEYMKSK